MGVLSLSEHVYRRSASMRYHPRSWPQSAQTLYTLSIPTWPRTPVRRTPSPSGLATRPLPNPGALVALSLVSLVSLAVVLIALGREPSETCAVEAACSTPP